MRITSTAFFTLLYLPNIYHLFSYIQNYIDKDNVEGILLYPTIDKN